MLADFYQDRCILITGASGFMGKVLVEKLLRSCGGVRRIFLLLRTKQGQEPKQRLEALINTKIFDRVRAECPASLRKLVCVAGDLTLPGLGISAADRETLVDSVSVVFHSAATVKFDEPLKRSVDMNVLGTRRLLELCQKFPHLEALVHVSTAYCNCDRDHIEEIVYKPPVPPQKIIDTIEWMDDDVVRALTPHLIGPRPNTYTYTKALAEALLVEEGGALPLAIVRPSIVTAAWREPFPGWVDNYNGPTGLIVATSKGILRSMHCRPSSVADLIPVDVVINLVIAVAWYTAAHRPNSILVYNCSSGGRNRLTWGEVERLSLPLIQAHPPSEVVFYPSGRFTVPKWRHRVAVLLQHHLPAYAMDALAVAMGRKPTMVALYAKLHRAVECLEYFTTHEWCFPSGNVDSLLAVMSEGDRRDFCFDIRGLEWPPYLEDYVKGIRHFLCKEEEDTLPMARTRMRRLYLYTKAAHMLALFLVWKFVLLRMRSARRLSYALLHALIALYKRLLPPH